jgi:hypothetical protein
MDLRRHLEVLRRFRLLVAGGVLAGIVLAFLATFSVGGSGVSWRKPIVYKSSSVLFVTQPGFPWGRANLPTDPGGAPSVQSEKLQGDADQNFADPSRFSGLAAIYSFIVRSEEVRSLIPSHPAESDIAAEPFLSNPSGNGDALPLIGMSTFGSSPAAAQQLNADTIKALLKYLEKEQNRTNTPAAQRAQVQVLNPPGAAEVSEGRELTGGIVLLLLCVIIAVALSYLLENLNPVIRREPEEPDFFEVDDPEGWDAQEMWLPDSAATSAVQSERG